MDDSELAALIADGAKRLGVSLPPGAPASFFKYFTYLEQQSHSMNLTSITGVKDVAQLHFLDSIALLAAAPFQGKRVIDIGSGAGFPGVPLLIAEPSISLTLLDASVKRVAFLTRLCAALSVSAAFARARAEEAAHLPGMREQFDVAVSRAVAHLNVLCELCLPYVRPGGFFLAMKGIDSSPEVSQALSAIEKLGAAPPELMDYTIPGTEIVHRALVIRKVSPTPAVYPRRYARISKSPL